MFGLLVQVPGLSLVPFSVLPGLLIVAPMVTTAPRSVRRLATAAVFALTAGLVVHAVSRGYGLESGSLATVISVVIWSLTLVVLPAMAWWSMKRIKPRTAILLMLVGGIASQLVLVGLSWKGSLGIFATALALIVLSSHEVLATMALVALAAIGFANDARSMAVGAGLAFVIAVVLRLLRRGGARLSRTLALLAAVAAVGAALVWGLAAGLAGAPIQERTIDQLNHANVIFGVRAEWAASLSLFQENPLGYGLAIQPSEAAVNEAITAVRDAGGDWTSNYFSQWVFGERVDLHSTLANMWFHFSVGGVVLAAAVGYLLFTAIRDARSTLGIYGLGGIYLAVMALWDLAFSPMGDIDRVIAGLCFALAAQFANSCKTSAPDGVVRAMDQSTAGFQQSKYRRGGNGAGLWV